MTSFGWKRKSNLSTSSAAVFSGEQGESEEEESWENEVVDWLTAAKRRKLILLEDSKTKSKRLVGSHSWSNCCSFMRLLMNLGSKRRE